MSILLASAIWGVLFYLGLTLKKTYTHLPLAELKRRARQHNAPARVVYQVRSFGASLDMLLWLWIGVSGAAFLYVVATATHGFWAVVSLLLIILFGFFWIPDSRVNKLNDKLAVLLAPVLRAVLNFSHPVLERLGLFVKKFQHLSVHSGLYEREDLIRLLEKQKHQPDNRISDEELSIAMHALSFGQELVRDVLIAKRVVRFVSIDDTIGPILMDELHDTGHSRFPVYDGKKDNVVGMLMLKDLVGKKSGGKIRDLVRADVYYIHESQNLYQALTVMLKTKHHLFLAVNSFEEIVGIVTLEDVIERIIGKPIMDEFDQYDDMRAVAERMAAKVHKEQKHDKDLPEAVPDNSQG
jgi:CBS domain containing-hemolysin-like protein